MKTKILTLAVLTLIQINAFAQEPGDYPVQKKKKVTIYPGSGDPKADLIIGMVSTLNELELMKLEPVAKMNPGPRATAIENYLEKTIPSINLKTSPSDASQGRVRTAIVEELLINAAIDPSITVRNLGAYRRKIQEILGASKTIGILDPSSNSQNESKKINFLAAVARASFAEGKGSSGLFTEANIISTYGNFSSNKEGLREIRGILRNYTKLLESRGLNSPEPGQNLLLKAAATYANGRSESGKSTELLKGGRSQVNLAIENYLVNNRVFGYRKGLLDIVRETEENFAPVMISEPLASDPISDDSNKIDLANLDEERISPNRDYSSNVYLTLAPEGKPSGQLSKSAR